MKNSLKKSIRFLLILFPPVFFFSYHPVISLGASESTNFELSLPEIWLVLFFFFSIPFIKDFLRYFSPKFIILASLIPTYLTLSIIWSGNRLRALLTAGLLWLIVFTALHLIYLLKTEGKGHILRSSLIKSLLFSASFVALFCWLQCFLDLAGATRETTLLCLGCTHRTFGFPHPNGFAIEPQFMGNLLLAPTLLCFYLLSAKPKNRKHGAGLTLLTLFLTATLFLTLSRGAIYAFIVALIVLLMLTRKKLLFAKSFACVLISFAISLVAFGAFSSFGSTSDTFVDGVAKAVHQLTLGKIDFRPTTNESAVSSESNEVSDSLEIIKSSNNNTAHFSGYVAESTDTRLNLNSLAIKTWASSPQYILFGAGLGAAGTAMHHAFPEEIGPKEIVQNQYVSLLLEAGLIGVFIILIVVIFTTISLIKTRLITRNPLFICIILGFALTLLFFSGLPNALHLYLFPLLFFNFNFRSKDNFLVADII